MDTMSTSEYGHHSLGKRLVRPENQVIKTTTALCTIGHIPHGISKECSFFGLQDIGSGVVPFGSTVLDSSSTYM